MSTAQLTDLEHRIYAGQRLSAEDGIALFECDNLSFLGKLARFAQQRRSGNHVFFNINRHLNLTNVCFGTCAFCSFARREGQPGAYTLSVDEAVEKAVAGAPDGLTELHVVNSLHPTLPFDYYVTVVRHLKAALPKVHIKAYTAVEIDHFSKIGGLSPEDVLRVLKEAGLASLTGGGAEIFAPRVRRAICPRKISAERWLEIHSLAHQLGLHTTATMLFGHLETPAERVDHILRLRALQDATGGFLVFVPLRFHNVGNNLAHVPMATAHEVLKTFAVSRVLLDNFAHLKAYWVSVGLETAQLALEFGVDDLDGTVVHEQIHHDAGASTPQQISKDALIRLIQEAGRIPTERDTVYNVVQTYGKLA
ncbi:MAG: aminofutalosine synthase MqnE [Chloroflexota bacterium]|nr:MAG: aminofutalosine synthase MqnE [Chloroflexota bacterium]